MSKENMKKNWQETQFSRQVRIHTDDLEWLKRNKGKYTIAGFLSKVLEKYRKGRKI